MNCREFEQIWQARLDDRAGGRDDFAGCATGAAWADHAALCASCRTRAAGWVRLERVLAEDLPTVELPAGFAERILAGRERATTVACAGRRGWWGRPQMFSAAAAVLLAAGGVTWMKLAGPVGEGLRARRAGASASRSIGRDLAEATAASWALARRAAGPAGELGRELIAPVDDARAAERVDVLGSSVEPATLALEDARERVAEGVAPLSAAARRAFGFLAIPAVPVDAKPAAGDRRGAGAGA
ncbi:MAG: hypothetical protein KGM43_06675 [Planctomycetota bacterium]|nr:hypothetical protein [Planctomycetota bacterium]